MKAQTLNLFIVDSNESLAKKLKEYLVDKFGRELRISLFNNGDSALEKIDRDTHMVILENTASLEGVEMVKSIKGINDKTEVVLLSDRDDISDEIEAMQAGAKDYIPKKKGSWKRIHRTVGYVFMAPIRLIVRELDISSRLAVFIMSFLTVGFAVVMWAIIWHKF